MPLWNSERKCYVEEPIDATTSVEREERFRTALLNELDSIYGAISDLETPSGGPDGQR